MQPACHQPTLPRPRSRQQYRERADKRHYRDSPCAGRPSEQASTRCRRRLRLPGPSGVGERRIAGHDPLEVPAIQHPEFRATRTGLPFHCEQDPTGIDPRVRFAGSRWLGRSRRRPRGFGARGGQIRPGGARRPPLAPDGRSITDADACADDTAAVAESCVPVEQAPSTNSSAGRHIAPALGTPPRMACSNITTPYGDFCCRLILVSHGGLGQWQERSAAVTGPVAHQARDRGRTTTARIATRSSNRSMRPSEDRSNED